MAEPRPHHPGPCNGWCYEHGCATTRPRAERHPNTVGAFAEAFRQEMAGAREAMNQPERFFYGTAGDPEFVGREVRIPVRRGRQATAHMWANDTLPPPETNYAEYTWLPDQDAYITPEGERITALRMQQLVEAGRA